MHNDSFDLDAYLSRERIPLGDSPGEGVVGGTHSFAAPTPVIPRLEEAKESFALCRFTGEPAVGGICMAHQSDACLSLYVRYNFAFETMEKEIKEAFVRTRRQMQ